MSLRVAPQSFYERKYPTNDDHEQMLNMAALCAVHKKAEEWGIDPTELASIAQQLYRLHVQIKEQSSCQLLFRAESLSRREMIKDLEAQIRVHTSSPIQGKIEKAQSKLSQLESEVRLKEQALAQAKEEQAAAALLHREALAVRANPNKSSQAKRKVNATWPQIHANKSRTEDLLRRAEAALEAARKAVSDQTFRISLLQEELARAPSFDVSRVEQRIRTLNKKIEASHTCDQRLDLEIQGVKRDADLLIESFIAQHPQSPAGDVKQKLWDLLVPS